MLRTRRLNNFYRYTPLLVLACVTFYLGRITAPRKVVTVIKTDTLTVETIVRDTVVKWYEKIKWKERKPDTIIIYQADTIPVPVEGPVILAVDYKCPRLKVLDNYARLHVYNDVGDEFSVRVKQKGLFVKSHKSIFHYNLATGLKYPFENPWYNSLYLKGEFKIRRLKTWLLVHAKGLEGGIEFKLIDK